jgi:hypothetical protein
MSLYKEFSALLPYLQSVRKIKTHLSFDVNFPKNWKLPKKFVQEDKVMEHQSQNPDERLISFVSEITEIEVDLQSLKFDVKVKKIELEDGEEELRTTGVVEK